eukprot:CAMPEP_0202693592 /NCGR_PEP_ID=MMETSP1385-20130828/7658_1 /ASSEMBLY_ACC=CAM_ASM_000861 /TAXON_ID=933848 /ORGANISM="Elphidium margaritaceum" /LENGTH=1374 /DNA_ID=CAMNT_0049349289 /DNA_START=197 /DNA_END=4321 /DNA_ORIENTATION=+
MTIFDIVLPGAHKAGMSIDSTTSIQTSQEDSYRLTLNSLGSNEEKVIWARRQQNSVLELLQSGARFLDLQFEHDGDDTYYSYNGLWGRSADDIIADVAEFVSNIGTNELILVYVNNFLGSGGNSALYSDQLKNLLTKFAENSVFASKAAHTAVDDLRATTISELVSSDVQIVLFTDELPSGAFAYDDLFYLASEYLYEPDSSTNSSAVFGQLDEVSDVRSFYVNRLRRGWPSAQLNVISWTLDVGGTFEEQFEYSGGFAEFSKGVNNELSRVVSAYPKLWLANVVLVDFFELSDVMEQILTLNHQYLNCRDAAWGNNETSCAAQTGLATQYYSSSLSPLCLSDSALRAQCPRSCGDCDPQLLSRAQPGRACTADADCDGIVYVGQTSTGLGTCFLRSQSNQREVDNIPQSSFCLSVAPQTACTNYDVQERCSDSTDEVDVDLSQCNAFCAAHWQCSTGFCNAEYSVCMTLEASQNTPAPTSGSRAEGYSFVESMGAEAMLQSVALFRPGDYEAVPDVGGVDCDSGLNADCLFAAMDANPYLASLVGFAVIPLFAALALCFLYSFCCCPCWCVCDHCAKKCCCCHKYCKNDPIENEDKVRQWLPAGLLAASLVVVIWACIEGIVNNSEMHDHIFGERDSVKAAVNNLFDDVFDRFEAVEPTVEYVIDFGVDIINQIFDILESNTDSISGTIDSLYDALDIIAANYSGGVNLSGTFINPFNASMTEPFAIECPYCSLISDTARDIKAQLNSSLGGQLDNIDSLINQTRNLVDAKDTIRNASQALFDTLNEVTTQAHDILNTTNEYIDVAAEYDAQYRERPAFVFFCIPIGLTVFAVLGCVLKNKWCFKCEWFCAMYCCGTSIMLLSWPFLFFAVLWGDMCVRLDEFERDMQQSQIGQLAFGNAANLSNELELGLQLVNTCFAGGSPLELFDLNDTLNWDPMRQQLQEQLDVDITGLLEGVDVSEFKTEIDGLSTDEFGSVVDAYISAANNVGDYCGCGEEDSPFTRANLYGTGGADVTYCVDLDANLTSNDTDNGGGLLYTTPIGGWPGTAPPFFTTPAGFGTFANLPPYWRNISMFDSGACLNAFVNASAAVQIEFSLRDDANLKIDGIKTDADRVFDVYDDMYGIALSLEGDIQSIGCLVEPLFDTFDVIIDNFTNCGFLGVAYGEFKEQGCVYLFDDWWKIARALTVIAWLSILVVLLSFCLDYVYGPVKERVPSVTDDDAAVQEHSLEYAAGIEMGMAEQPGSVPDPNWAMTDAAPAAVGTYEPASNMVAVQSYSQAQTHGPVSSVASLSGADQQSHAGSAQYGVPYQPPVAESDVQEYSINFDQKNANGMPVHQMAPISQEPDLPGEAMDGHDGGFATHEEPAVPMDEGTL